MQVSFQGATPLFYVFDVPSSVAFYRDLLGFDVVSTSRSFDDRSGNYGWVMLRRDSVTLMVNNMDEGNICPGKPDAIRTRARQDTVLYISSRELDTIVQHLRAKGITVRGPSMTYYGILQVTIQDPGRLQSLLSAGGRSGLVLRLALDHQHPKRHGEHITGTGTEDAIEGAA